MGNFKLGDIIENKEYPFIGLFLIEAVDKYFYDARFITGYSDGMKIHIFINEESEKYHKKVGNIFEKGAAVNDGDHGAGHK